MKIAAFQFRASQNIENNLAAIHRGVAKASDQQVRFLITQECALCGYPPVERDEVASIDFCLISEALHSLKQEAVAHHIVIGLGTVLKRGHKYRNSIVLITPETKNAPPYHKRALWGWDVQNFSPGKSGGIYEIDGIRIGIRICFEVRFPEYFRELFKENVQIAFVSLCDVSDRENLERYEILKSHLITRAVENAMVVVSANSISKFQTAPTCVVDPDGYIIKTAPRDEEHLLVYGFENFESNFGRNGRILHSKKILGMQ